MAFGNFPPNEAFRRVVVFRRTLYVMESSLHCFLYACPSIKELLFSGVYNVTVSLLPQKAEVLFDPDQTSEETIANYIRALGFGAEVLDNENVRAKSIEFRVSDVSKMSVKYFFILKCTGLFYSNYA